MDSIAFSDQEIEDELARLGYHNIPRDKLKEFQRGTFFLILLTGLWITACCQGCSTLRFLMEKAYPYLFWTIFPAYTILSCI